MPEYLTPGVYTEEIELGSGSLLSVSTSTAGFLGKTERGPSRPRLITSMTRFTDIFGGFLKDSYLAYAIKGFFDNGGDNKRCFVARVVSAQDSTASSLLDIGAFQLRMDAVGPGIWGSRIYYKFEQASSKKPGLFKLTLVYFGSEEVPQDSDIFHDPYDTSSPPNNVNFVPDPNSKFIRNFINGRKDQFTLDGPYDELSSDPSSRSYYKMQINGVSELIFISDNFPRDGSAASVTTPPPTQFMVSKFTTTTTTSGTTTTTTITLADADKQNLLAFIGKYFTPNNWATNATVDNSKSNILDLIKVGDIKPAGSLEYDQTASMLTLKINGRTSYQFSVGPDPDPLATNGFLVFAPNIVPLDTTQFPRDTSGQIKDNPVTISDYEGVKHQVWDPDDKVDPVNNTHKVEYTGLQAFEQIDEISLVSSPDQAEETETSTIKDAIIEHCEKMKDRFAILQATRSQSTSIETFIIDRESKFAAIYAPWIWVSDPLVKSGEGILLVPPGGHVAGIYARSDEIGVHKAPANETVNGALNLQVQFTPGDQAILNPRGINLIRSFPGYGILVWGARTISSEPQWIYLNTRRVIAHVFKTARRSLVPFVFLPNNERLWARIVATITPFLTGLRLSGALMGTKDEDAFKIRCDRTTMTQDDIDNGRLIVIIALALTKPAEFVIIRVAQTREGAGAEELGGL